VTTRAFSPTKHSDDRAKLNGRRSRFDTSPMRKTAARFGWTLFGGIVGYIIGSMIMFGIAVLISAASHELLGYAVFLYDRRGVEVGAIIGAIAGAALVWRAATRQQS
jgi:CHASE2 domain-containing sensor protein